MMAKANQAAADTPRSEKLPVEPYPQVNDGNVEDIWRGIERAYSTSRKHNREVLRDHVGATAAAALNFGSQMLHLGLFHPGLEIDGEEESEGATECNDNSANPTQPAAPQEIPA